MVLTENFSCEGGLSTADGELGRLLLANAFLSWVEIDSPAGVFCRLEKAEVSSASELIDSSIVFG